MATCITCKKEFETNGKKIYCSAYCKYKMNIKKRLITKENIEYYHAIIRKLSRTRHVRDEFTKQVIKVEQQVTNNYTKYKFNRKLENMKKRLNGYNLLVDTFEEEKRNFLKQVEDDKKEAK